MMKKLIIDTDVGPDDALAIILALAMNDSWSVIAITCVYGNTKVENVCSNVMTLLKVCKRGQIPVYSGCDRPLVKQHSAPLIFHEDGLGGASHHFPNSGLQLAGGHAANALVDLAKKHQNDDIHLMALGPLTNVAMAHRLDPNFTANFKSIVIMGGNTEGIGNTTSAAEFNFFCDPESAHIVLNEARCPLTMVPWETALNNVMPWEIYESLCCKDTELTRYFKLVTAILVKYGKAKGRRGLLDPDFLAVASLVSPECVLSRLRCPVSVETRGEFTRGQAIIERKYDASVGNRNIVDIVTGFNESSLNILRNLMLDDT